MKNIGRFLWASLVSLVLLYGQVSAETKPVGFAIPFPNLSLDQALSEEERAYLGVPRKKTFALHEIRGELILVEFFNVYCVNCQRQAPILNSLYSSIEKDKALRGKVKVIGIAAGNNHKEVDRFKKDYSVLYPLVQDLKYDAHTAVGSPRTPFSIWVRKDQKGRGVVMSTHLGLMDPPGMALNETRAVLQYDLALFNLQKGSIYKGDGLKPPLPENELMARAKQGMEASGGKVLQIEKVLLKDGDWVYAGKVDFGTRTESLFSKLASRQAVCDICHDTFFIYTFDAEGKVVEIVPIQLTKNDNLNWTEEDIQKLRSRTLGRSILKPFPFDPGVDSISGATITTALIFDSLDKVKEIYRKLKNEKHIK